MNQCPTCRRLSGCHDTHYSAASLESAYRRVKMSPGSSAASGTRLVCVGSPGGYCDDGPCRLAGQHGPALGSHQWGGRHHLPAQPYAVWTSIGGRGMPPRNRYLPGKLPGSGKWAKCMAAADEADLHGRGGEGDYSFKKAVAAGARGRCHRPRRFASQESESDNRDRRAARFENVEPTPEECCPARWRRTGAGSRRLRADGKPRTLKAAPTPAPRLDAVAGVRHGTSPGGSDAV